MKRIHILLIAVITAADLTACGVDGASAAETEPAHSEMLAVTETETTYETETETACRTEPETTYETETEAASQTEPEIEPETEIIHVESLTLSAYEATLAIGESFMPIVTMAPADAADLTEIWWSSDAAVAVVDIYGNITAVGEGECTVTVLSADNKDVFAVFNVTVSPPPETEPKTVAGVTYIDGILVVNKSYPLPEDYNPGEDPEASAALYAMFAAAAEDGCNMYVVSGFRSYETQAWLYNSYVQRDGIAAADRYSARPGYSEHQTGLAFDINDTSDLFASTREARWLAENAYKYGFILRYPEGKEHITGYMFEPWHYRYVGIENARRIYESGLTIEEYLGITSSYS